MPVSFATGSFQKSGSQSYPVSQSVTVGFLPKAFMLFGISSGTTATTNFTDVERSGFGWTTGSTANYSLSWGSDDATSSGTLTNTFRRARNDYCYTQGSSASSAYPQIRCTGFTSTTATFEYDLNDTNTHRLFWLAIGGTDITNAKAGEFNSITTTGNQTVTGVGFQPSVVFFLTGNSPNLTHPASGSSSTSHMCVTLGIAKSSTAEACMSLSSVDEINPSDSARYQRNDKCISFFTEGTTTVDAEADLVSMNSDGFTINWTSAPTVSQPIYYLAIAGGSWNVGTTLARTTTDGTGTRAITTPLVHTPKGVILFGHQGNATNAVQTNSKLSFGAAASTTSAVQMASGNMDATTVPSSYRQYNVGSTTGNVYVYKSHDLGTANANNDMSAAAETDELTSRALFQSFDTNAGFTLNWDTVDSSAREVIYVTVGDNVGASLVKVLPAETVGLTEAAPIRNRGFSRTLAAETVGLTDAIVRKSAAALAKTIAGGTVGLTEGALVKVIKKVAVVAETVGISTDEIVAQVLRRVRNETVGLTELMTKLHVVPTATMQASVLQLRYSNAATAGTNSASRGGAMSNNIVTDNTLNNTWDDVTPVQSAAGLTEYRCYYIYNSHATMTAYNCEVWIDTDTPAGDSIQIGVGTAAMGGTEQGPLAAETTAPTAVSFSTAPDSDSAIPLGDIPPVTGRSIWIKRIVPAGTGSWSDNQYRLRMSFFSNIV